MARGKFRIFLGAAPGVGKTYSMLEEGRRLADEGKDVVIGIVETHGRAATAAMTRGLDVLPTRAVTYRGLTTQELDVAAVVARHPDIVLVDELAHTNAPGSTYPKRWQDVRDILDAGINVMTTVNVQHIESLNDVVETITGVPQRETVPDDVMRTADQTEVVDIAPSALRQRLAEGCIYPAERVDAALSNYFRLGNLTALRELALLWMADDVDAALRSYRTDHGISNQWETRERVVVALSGGPEGEILLRRGARIAARAAGGDLIAVYVNSEDGLRHGPPGTLTAQRTLVEHLGGTYHQIIGTDIPEALIEFARGMNATQLVLGASKRSRLSTIIEGQGVGEGTIRKAGPIDVHIVNHQGKPRRITIPHVVGAVGSQRQFLGFAFLAIAGPLLTLLLAAVREPSTLVIDVLTYQLLVIVVALIGGFWPALVSAIAVGLALDFYFITPLFTVTISDPLHFASLVLSVLNALLVSYVVDQAARRNRLSTRARAESELLSTVAGSVLRGQGAIEALLGRSREAFALDGVRIIADNHIVRQDGEFTADVAPESIELGKRGTLEYTGRLLDATERRLMTVIAAQAEAALEHSDLEKTASEVGALTETDHVRSALLSAVSHDLRRPLSAATIAVSALRTPHANWSETDTRELLDTAQESLDTLASLVTNLLDTTRLQAGVLAVSLRPTSVDDVILPALDELSLGPDQIALDLEPNPPLVSADQVLLQRVVVNLLTNAERFAPAGTRVRVSSSQLPSVVEIRVTDHGPGVRETDKEGLFTPFQRQGDTDNLSGLGLGLAIAKGFTEGMGGTLEAEDTPGGGLTMVISLPRWNTTVTAPVVVAARAAAAAKANGPDATSTQL